MNNRGFTTTETMVTLGVLGVLAVIAVPTYGYYTKKTQVTEAFRLMDEQRAKIEVIKKLKSCTASSGVPDSFVGKYGTLVVSGNYVPSSGPTCPTGCIATFTVNGVADKELQGKTVTAQILNNGSLSKVSGSTTIPDKYLPSLFTTQSSLNGDSCSALAGDATQTAGGSGLSGTTAADPVPVPPPPPPPPVQVTSPYKDLVLYGKYEDYYGSWLHWAEVHFTSESIIYSLDKKLGSIDNDIIRTAEGNVLRFKEIEFSWSSQYAANEGEGSFGQDSGSTTITINLISGKVPNQIQIRFDDGALVNYKQKYNYQGNYIYIPINFIATPKEGKHKLYINPVY